MHPYLKVLSDLGRSDYVDEASLFSFPLSAFALQLLFQNTGFPYGKIFHIVGDEASFKTTFSLMLAKLHIDLGGFAFVFDTETRPVPDIHKGIFGENYAERFTAVPCKTLEQWESALYYTTKQFKSYQDETKSPIPLCLIVDSLLGCNSKSTIEQLDKSGYLDTRWAVEARSISDYLRSYTQSLLGSFTTVCLVNHRKYRVAPGPYAHVQKTSLGGNEIRYYSGVELELSRKGEKPVLGPVKTYEIALETYKNTYGSQRISIHCPICFTYENEKLQIEFDWDTATVWALMDYEVKPKLPKSQQRKVVEICKIESRMAGVKGEVFWCEQLGITREKALPAKELGKLINSNTELLEKLYPIYGITPRYIYDFSKSYDENLTEYKKFCNVRASAGSSTSDDSASAES